MPPIPCAHCGHNFMRPTNDPEAPKLCNNCLVREDKRNPKPKETMDTVDILIKCPKQVQIDIEEYCINQGIDFSKYFLQLHDVYQASIQTVQNVITPKQEALKHAEEALPKKKGGKK